MQASDTNRWVDRLAQMDLRGNRFTAANSNFPDNAAWDPATDISNAKPDGTEPGLRSGSTPRRSGYTLQMNLPQIQAAAKTAGQAADGSYTIPFFTPIPVETTSLMVQMDGHPKALPPGVTASSIWCRRRPSPI